MQIPCFYLASLFVLAAAKEVSYDGYQTFSIGIQDDLDEIKEKLSDLNIVSLGCGDGHAEHFDVAVSPDSLPDFEALGLPVTVLSKDLGADFALESTFEKYNSMSISRESGGLPDLSWFNSYHDYADHRLFFEDLNAAFPNNSDIFTTGESYEGREIYGIQLWGKDGKDTKPAIFLHATVHAREWIAAPTEEYIAWQLINGYLSGDATISAIVDKYDFYLIPFVNPDGFVYTQTNDRLWRKNRQPRSSSSCVGTDANRNWPFNWHLPDGASTNPCSETYKGVEAGDTPEVSSIVPLAKRLGAANGVKLFIDFHSYGQYILLPYGYDCTAVADNHNDQMEVAAGTAEQIRRTGGSRYIYGPSCATLYATTGSSPDYFSGTIGAEYSWTIELRPSPSGGGGFVLPPAQILPTVKETWEGVKYALATI